MPRYIDLADYEWFCDNCNDSLDNQDGFDPYCGEWKCTKCGHVNQIDEFHIVILRGDPNFEDDEDEHDSSLDNYDPDHDPDDPYHYFADD